MKIIEAMKQNKALTQKAEDLRAKVAKYAADLDYETPTYGTEQDQRAQIGEWVQSHHDILQQIAQNRVAIQRTNLATEVTIQLNGTPVTKTIAEWIHRRRDLAQSELEMWSGMGRKADSMREGPIQTSTGERKDVKIRRYFEPVERDTEMGLFRDEPNVIDSTLEIINATTDLVE